MDIQDLFEKTYEELANKSAALGISKTTKNTFRKRGDGSYYGHIVCFVHKVCEAVVRPLQQELIQLREAQRWIPVSERMPNEDGTYWICDKYGDVTDLSFIDGGFIWNDVTHWMPLPTAPQEISNEHAI